MMDETLTQPELVKKLGFSRQTLYKWRTREKDPLPFLQPSGKNGSIIYNVRDVGEWLERQNG